MSQQVVFISGSPQNNSRSARVARAVLDKLEADDVRVRSFGLSDFESTDLLYGRVDNRAGQHYLDTIKGSAALIFSTPVYKATYSGGLKLLVDLIPPDALRGKTVLAVASARVGRHFQSVQRAFEDLYRFFDVGFVLQPVFVLDEQLREQEGRTLFDDGAQTAIDRAATTLRSSLVTPDHTTITG